MAKKEAERRAMAKLEKDRQERGQADELAGAMSEFFAQFYGEGITVDDGGRAENSLSSSLSELPIPSPDSITVTTEFGVMAEPANMTTISAAGPSPYHHAYDHSDEEENNVEMTENLHENMEMLQYDVAHIQLPMDVAALTPQSIPEVEMEDEDDVNDTGEEADIDTDDFDADAESAIIEEFIDDGLQGGFLTPTTTHTTIHTT